MMIQDDLKAALKVIAEKHWKLNKQPILLSDVGPALSKDEETRGYRACLDGKSLKSFIKDTSEKNSYRLVEHPTQNAKVALLPFDEKFEFNAEVVGKSLNKSKTVYKNENKVLTLLEILARLPESDLAQISIPVSALVKLLK